MASRERCSSRIVPVALADAAEVIIADAKRRGYDFQRVNENLGIVGILRPTTKMRSENHRLSDNNSSASTDMTGLPIAQPSPKRCGKCCMQVGRPPFAIQVSPHVPPESVVLKPNELPKNIPDALVQEVQQYILDVIHQKTPDRMTARLPCSWLDLETMLCRHYEFRPKLCREFDCSESGLDCEQLK